jgi:tetratricopeptide (TPR) repeat protein
MVEAYLATGGLEQAASILEMLVELEPHNEQHRTKLRWLREQKGVAGGGSFEVDLSQQAPRTAGAPLAFSPPPKPGRPPGIELSGPLSPDDQEFISEHLAEGRVFRKYGLGDKARDQFEAVLGRFPDNLEALSELCDIFKEKGDSAGAGQKLRVMAEVHRLKGETDKAARADTDADALVGPVVAAQAAVPAAPAAAARAPAAPVPVPVPKPASPPAARTAPPIAVAPPPAEMEVEIPVEEPAALAPQDDELEYVELAEPAPPLEFDVSDLAPAGEIGSQYLDVEPPPADAGFDLDEAPPVPGPVTTTGLRAQPAPAAAPDDAGVPADLRRAIDEIESYVSMGFVDDARGVLGEVAARLGAYPALVQRLAELGLEVEAASEMDSLLGEAPVEEPLQLGEGFLEFTPSTSLPAVPVPEPVAAGGDGEGFDLASELGDLFGAQPAVAEEPATALSSTDLGDASLADIFREFQKGVDKQLGKEDYETRYNLGIAYKEMGLVDEAIAEFQLAAKDEGRLLECSSMLGICFLEKGMPKLAVKWFEKGLQAPGRSDEEYQGLRYDLASALEQGGEGDRALALFTELYGQDASFRDVADKMRQLGG